MIVHYIKKQKEHHRKKSFADEYFAFLQENMQYFDSQYVFDDSK